MEPRAFIIRTGMAIVPTAPFSLVDYALPEVLEVTLIFFERKMKIFIFCSLNSLLFLFISGCELLCQAGTGTCGMSSEQMDKLLHPKAYGEYFFKLGASREEWQRDWVACGGMSDGGYSSDARPGSSTEVLINASKQKRSELATCMVSKGYEHQKGFEY
jgi:hypothetical protein